MSRKLYRNIQEGALSGVCAGLGEYLEIDAVWVRLIFVLSVLFSPVTGFGLLGAVVYVVLWIVLPAKPQGLPITSTQSPYDVDYRVHPEATSTRYDATRGTGTGEGASDRPRHKSGRTSDRTVTGLILVSVGVLFMLHQLDVLHWYDFTRYWPLILIIAGLAIVLEALKERQKFTRRETGPSTNSDTGSAEDTDTTAEHEQQKSL